MAERAESEDKFLQPSGWWGWILAFAIGTAVTVAVSLVFGISPVDALLLKEIALAPFVIVDYVLGAFGLRLALRHFLGRLST